MNKSKERIRDMFDSIAPKYDLLNHVLSMGIDKGWRRKVVKEVKRHNPSQILDVATGTCDLAIALAKGCKSAKITGIDLSPEMLAVGATKVDKKDLKGRIELSVEDALNMSYPSESFDALTVAFGVRNFEDLPKGLAEFKRVLKNGGRVYILEFSKPSKGLFASLYNFYSKNILPLIGRMVSKDSRAYTYLPESVIAFPCGKDFESILSSAGFKDISTKKLTMGIASLYTAIKDDN